MAAILARALHQPLHAGKSPLKDVPANAWYGQDVIALHAAGLVNGVSATLFDPKDTITMSQAVALILRTEAYIAAGK